MSLIDDVIVRIQTIALSITSEEIKSAPAYPNEDALTLPQVITHIIGGSVECDNITVARLKPVLSVDIHVNPLPLKHAYTQIDNIIPEFCRRLCGDPALNETGVIIFPVSYNVVPAEYNGKDTIAVSFRVPIKILSTPTT